MALAELKNWFARHRAPPRPAMRITRIEPGFEAEAVIHNLPPGPASVWSNDRLAVEEELWGAGYLTPGGAPELLRFSVPLGLSAASSLLVLGAGAGGPPQTLATDLGVWTAAFESDPVLAGIAAHRLQRAGAALAKRASVEPWDPAAPAFRAHFYHHALLLDPIRAAMPEPVLAAVESALKPHGQVVLVQTVADPPLDPADPAIAAWCRLEGRISALPSADSINRALGRLGYDIRIAEDMSARHMKLAVLGWKALLRRMKDHKPDHARAAAIVTEAELWTRRIRLMHEGRIRMMRWHAIHRASVR